jgi:hypothetical protein
VRCSLCEWVWSHETWELAVVPIKTSSRICILNRVPLRSRHALRVSRSGSAHCSGGDCNYPALNALAAKSCKIKDVYILAWCGEVTKSMYDNRSLFLKIMIFPINVPEMISDKKFASSYKLQTKMQHWKFPIWIECHTPPCDTKITQFILRKPHITYRLYDKRSLKSRRCFLRAN